MIDVPVRAVRLTTVSVVAMLLGLLLPASSANATGMVQPKVVSQSPSVVLTAKDVKTTYWQSGLLTATVTATSGSSVSVNGTLRWCQLSTKAGKTEECLPDKVSAGSWIHGQASVTKSGTPAWSPTVIPRSTPVGNYRVRVTYDPQSDQLAEQSKVISVVVGPATTQITTSLKMKTTTLAKAKKSGMQVYSYVAINGLDKAKVTGSMKLLLNGKVIKTYKLSLIAIPGSSTKKAAIRAVIPGKSFTRKGSYKVTLEYLPTSSAKEVVKKTSVKSGVRTIILE